MEGQPFLRTHACGICRTRHTSQSGNNSWGSFTRVTVHAPSSKLFSNMNTTEPFISVQASSQQELNNLDPRKIRLIEGNAKCHHLKELTCNGTLRQVFICLMPRTPNPPSLHTVYVYTELYTYSHRKKRGERGWVEPERRGEKQYYKKLGWKYQYDWLYLQSINT